MLGRVVPAAMLLLLSAMASPDRLLAQSGTIAGRVVDRSAGTPVVDVRIEARSASNVAEARTDSAGRYRLSVAAGSYTVVAQRLGYTAERATGVEVTANATRTLDLSLAAAARMLEQMVVTGTGSVVAEKSLELPISISVVSAGSIEKRTGATVTDYLKSEPGLAISTGGIAQSNVVSRGFNNAFSTSMLMLQDYRFAGVPSLRVNVPFLFTGTSEDIERIEVLQGPAASVYGPNSGNGVLHVITKSPFSAQGGRETTISLDGGERSLARGALRHAAVIGDKFGYKLSGEYFRAQDFEYLDPNEPARFSSTDTRVPASRRGQPVVRDFDLEKFGGEARIDFRPTENTELISTAGYSMIGSGLEVTTTFGAAQVKNWSYLNLQQRFRHKQFFAQLFYNSSNSGNDNALDDQGTFYLRSGIPVVDKSSVMVGQVQQALTLGRTRFVAGGEYIATRPQTAGTINGRNEDDDSINEVGGYLQTTTAVHPKLDLVLAARGDMNSRIEGAQFSPRAAIVVKPTSNHNFRLTFSRAFNSPASFSYFLDQYSGQTPAPGMPVQIMGNPAKEGWTFARTCTGGAAGNLCMRSPYIPNTLAPASAAAAYPGFIQALPQIVQGLPASASFTEAQRQQLLGVLTQLGPVLRALRPNDTQVGTVLMDLAANPATPVTEVRDFGALTANFSNTLEAGYKGILGDRVRLAADVWFQKRPADPTTQIFNPGVLFNGPQLGAYLGTSIATALIQQGMPAAQAQATAAAAAPAIAGVMARIPIGATAFTHANYTEPYLVFSYRNSEGFVNVWGSDFAADFVLGRGWELGANYSFLNKNVFTDAPGATESNPLASNTPKHRGSATLRYENDLRGFSGEVRGRYADAFPVNSGVFNSYGIGTPNRYAPVPVNALVDVGASWKLPVNGQPRWSVNVTNLLDNDVPTFVGVPAIGRLITTRIAYTF